MAKKMARETEIKLKIGDLTAFRKELARIGARVLPGFERVHEENVIFDTLQGRLGQQGQLLRIRTETMQRGRGAMRAKKRFLVTFKRPMTTHAEIPASRGADNGYKVREELELQIADAAILAKIFAGLGMPAWFRYEKYRTTYRLPPAKKWATGLLIEIDETPVGTFVELEGPAKAIDRAATQLGFSKSDYVLKNYLTLYREECQRSGEEPKNMLFPKRKPRRN
jgi:adenylate cyclase, class 2